MPATLWLGALALVCLAAPSCASANRTAAQIPNEPDFSGEWVLVKASGSASDQPFTLIVRQSITRTTVYGTPMTPFFSDVTIERHFKSGVVLDSYKIGVEGGTVFGTPPGASSPQVVWTRWSVKWESNRLVIKNSGFSGPTAESGSYTDREEVWSFDAMRRLVIAVTDRGSNIETRTATLIYRRR